MIIITPHQPPTSDLRSSSIHDEPDDKHWIVEVPDPEAPMRLSPPPQPPTPPPPPQKRVVVPSKSPTEKKRKKATGRGTGKSKGRIQLPVKSVKLRLIVKQEEEQDSTLGFTP